MRRQALLIAIVLGVAGTATSQEGAKAPLRQDGTIGGSVRPVGDYSRATGLLFAVGVVTDVELDPTCAGRAVSRENGRAFDLGSCIAAGGLLQMRVVAGSDGAPKGQVVVQLPWHDQSSRETDRIQVGDVITTTFLRVKKPEGWSCGRLQSCSTPPPTTYDALELFKRAQWP